MKLGVSKVCITPSMPLRLSGYAIRNSNFTEVKEDIYIRVYYFLSNDSPCLLVYADLLWWNSEFIKKIRPILQEKYALKPHQVFFVASHNHSGPPTGDSFTKLLEEYSPAYEIELQDKVFVAIEEARTNVEEIKLEFYEGSCHLNVYRRVMADNQIAMRPNYEVEADHHLTVLACVTEQGKNKGLLVHYPCHANLSQENVIQPDYPGVALRMLDAEYGTTAMFLQGCTADLRPNCVVGTVFTPVGYKEVVAFAEQFVSSVRMTLKHEKQEMKSEVSTSLSFLDLPLENLLSEEELIKNSKEAEGVTQQRAEKVIQRGSLEKEILEMGTLDFGSTFRIITFNAEVSQFYAKIAREFHAPCLCACYTNGMIGYITTAKQIQEGGYEPKGSAEYFALRGTYKAEIESLILKELMSK
ncbi:MAG: neutral/alkaline non-lysosomal ceramidase N-terminal domain-containing protein [Sphaerochaeta sp.]|nr:neutral/alkaline non-lysosomal ceramidase N-terminal domain-containing protein [Sphaerochaeta sp.]